MSNTTVIIFIALVVALFAIGYFSLGYLWGYKAGERKWLNFIDKNFDRRSDAAIKRDSLKPRG